MKNTQNILGFIASLMAMTGLTFIAIALFRSVGSSGATAPATQELTGYPPPNTTPAISEPTLSLPPTIAFVMAGSPTPWLTFTPPPQPTPRPGPTEAPLPLPTLPLNSEGSISFVSSSKPDIWGGGNSIKLFSLPVDSVGISKGAPIPITGDAELNLQWNNLIPSPDGKRVAIMGEWGAIIIIDTATGKEVPLIRQGYGGLSGFMDWHPDNQRILYRADAGSDSGVWLLGTTDFTLLYKDGDGLAAIRGGVISPDGFRVVYSYWRGGGVGELRMINTDGSNSHVFLNSEGDIWPISWAPDGKSLLFVDGQGLGLVNSDGTNPRWLTLKGITGSLPANFSWSPNSRTIAYVSSPPQEKGATTDSIPFRRATIRLLDVTTGDDHPLLQEEGNTDPAWSPTGFQIAFVSVRTGAPEIWVINTDGSNLHQVTNLGQFVRFPFWQGLTTPQIP